MIDTEFNVADVEKAMQLIEANAPFSHIPDELKDAAMPVIFIYRRLFIAGARTLATAVTDGLSDDGVKIRATASEGAASICSIANVKGDDAEDFVRSIFESAGRAVQDAR